MRGRTNGNYLKIIKTAVNPTTSNLPYFQAPRHYFWRWAEAGGVAEWAHGATVAYRDELAEVLAGLAPDGLPPLGALLLALGACAESWRESSEGLSVLNALLLALPADEAPGAPGPDELRAELGDVVDFLDVIAALPPDLRTGFAKSHLLREIFRAAAPAVPAAEAGGLVSDWTSGRLDAALTAAAGPTRAHFRVDLAPLTQASRRFPTTASLALRLRTGLTELPAPLPELPDLPEPPPADLLTELAQDARTAGLARLAQRLVAALRIPLHAEGASDQPLGGVAGLTNRGSFDRLLLSELANDDLTLTARLVNNEALYLRREAPPAQEQPQRVVLLDTTLKMWGVSRVFGLAAALACAHHGPAPAAAYALGGEHAEPLDLETKEGVVAALGALDPALHCGPALRAVLAGAGGAGAADAGGGVSPSASPLVERLLITEAQLAAEPAFGRYLAAARPQLRFLLTVDRGGELHFYEFTPAGRVLLGTTRYDLDALLFGPAPAPLLTLPPASGELPAFLDCAPSPLFFPTVSIKPGTHNTFHNSHLGVVAVTDARRLLYWPRKDTGARELLPVIEEGAYCFGELEGGRVGLMVSHRYHKLLRYYAFSLTDGTVESVDLSAAVGEVKNSLEARFAFPEFFIRLDEEMVIFDTRTAELSKRRPLVNKEASPSRVQPDFNAIKRFLNNGYNVMQRVARLEVSAAGELLADGHALQLLASGQLKWANARQPTSHRAVAQADADAEPVRLSANPHLPGRRHAWPDGSTAIVDARGLLHLRSADPDLPELTLVLVLGKATAAWAADGAVAGSPYFTGPAPAAGLPAAEFYRQYLQPFISRLVG